MTNIHDETYWSTQFAITQDDLNRVAEQLDQDGVPQELQQIALHIIRWRMEHNHGPIDHQAEVILLKNGERILSHLAEALQSDSRFVSFEGKWFITNKLPPIEHDVLRKLHQLLMKNSSLPIDEMLSIVKVDKSTNKMLLRIALHNALRQLPERFENIGTTARPRWKARLPDIEQAEVTHYAYDPETYEILCRPGQRLSQKKAQRLQELNLYAHVITFAE